jgi:flavorubredoxin
MFTPTELHNDGGHVCLSFSDLVGEGAGEAVQANQFLVVDDGDAALIDPGGNMTYHALYMAMQKHFPPKKLRYVLASHADPDIIASLARWLSGTDCTLVISSIWSRFVPHFCTGTRTEGRILAVPDAGGLLPLGRGSLVLLPAHFLHSEGNFQFYDPVSRILFSGDLGASLMPPAVCGRPVTDFAAHVPNMLGFHQRYMVSNRIGRLWARMVRGLDVEAIVPQHGPYFRGKPMVKAFVDWIDGLQCGIDLATEASYTVPKAVLPA